jgi:hypothetical protein
MGALGKCEAPRRDGEFISIFQYNLPIYFDERLIHSSPQFMEAIGKKININLRSVTVTTDRVLSP